MVPSLVSFHSRIQVMSSTVKRVGSPSTYVTPKWLVARMLSDGSCDSIGGWLGFYIYISFGLVSCWIRVGDVELLRSGTASRVYCIRFPFLPEGRGDNERVVRNRSLTVCTRRAGFVAPIRGSSRPAAYGSMLFRRDCLRPGRDAESRFRRRAHVTF